MPFAKAEERLDGSYLALASKMSFERSFIFLLIKPHPGGTEWQFLVPPSLLNCSSALRNRNFFFFGHAGALYYHHSFLSLWWVQIHNALLRFHYKPKTWNRSLYYFVALWLCSAWLNPLTSIPWM